MKKIGYILILVCILSGCTTLNWWGGSNNITVHKGDTLYSLSRKYNVPIKDLISANRLSSPYTLYVGQTLFLPTKQYHTVQRGESLYAIARQHNTDVATLSKINNLKTPYSLSVGQKLMLPASGAILTSADSSFIALQPSGNAQKYQNNAVPTTPPAAYRRTKFEWPIQGTVISGFGNLGKGRKNDGINIKAALGTSVKAADSGTVAYAGNELKGFGNLILIKHTDGWITAYAHNDKLLVKKGQKVARGEKIATVGQTGSVTTPQLHFEVRTGKKAVNPRPYLP